jgi:hypothetical protein
MLSQLSNKLHLSFVFFDTDSSVIIAGYLLRFGVRLHEDVLECLPDFQLAVCYLSLLTLHKDEPTSFS